MEMHPNREQDAEEIRKVFDQYQTIKFPIAKRQLDLTTGVDGKIIADTVLLSIATARESFEAFQEAFKDGIEENSLPRIFVVTLVELADGINKMYQGLSDTTKFPLNGDEIVAWTNGEGPKVTQDHVDGLIAFLSVMQKVMDPLRQIMTDFVREGDPYEGDLFVHVALLHYIQGVLSTCDCRYMEMGFEEGVDLSNVDTQYKTIRSRIDGDSKRLQRMDASMSSHIDSESQADISSDLQSMMKESGTTVN